MTKNNAGKGLCLGGNFILFNCYRLQRSWGKVIFSVACVKNSVHRGGTWAGTPRTGTSPLHRYPQGRYTPLGRYTPGQVHPPCTGTPRAGTPPLAGTPPGRYIPPAQVPPGQVHPPWQVHPRAGTSRMVIEQAVLILLECISCLIYNF